MNASPRARKTRPGGGAAKRRARPKAGAARARRPGKHRPGTHRPGTHRPGTRAAFSIALSLFALPMAAAGLLIPLPAGLAAVLTAGIALIAGRGLKWPGRIARAALVLGICGLAGGLVIGIAVTAPA